MLAQEAAIRRMLVFSLQLLGYCLAVLARAEAGKGIPNTALYGQ
jgi:hypothetical protein